MLERGGVVVDLFHSGTLGTSTSVSPFTHCMYVAGSLLCSYRVPELRWFLSSTLDSVVVWVRRARNLIPLNVKSKWHALRWWVTQRCSNQQHPWWRGGPRLPDMGNPTWESAPWRMSIYPNCRNPPWAGNAVACAWGPDMGNHILNDVKLVMF